MLMDTPSVGLQAMPAPDEPRVRHLYIVLNEVEETPMHGNKPRKLGRDKPQITIVSSEPNDCIRVINKFLDSQKHPEKYEEIEIYGVGSVGIANLEKVVNERKQRRSRNHHDSDNNHDSDETEI